MNLRSRKKVATVVIILLVTVCFIPTMAGATAPGDQRQGKVFERQYHHRPALGIWRNPQMVQKLELTENQIKQIKDVDFTFREKRLALKAQLDGYHLKMDKAISEDRVDDAAVLKIAQQVSNIRGKMFVQEIESRLSLGKILTADQIKKMGLYDMSPKRKKPKAQVARHPERKTF